MTTNNSETRGTNPLRDNLPPDPEKMNDQRSAWAEATILTFRGATHTDHSDALCDLLADLMHSADRNEFDFDAVLERARYHYQAETTEKDL